MSMINPSPLNQTIGHWNQSLKKPLQIHLSGCSACSYACKSMIMFFATALVRKCPPRYTLTFQAKTLPWHCIGYCHPPACPLLKRKPSNMAFEMDVENTCPGWYHHPLAVWMTSRKSHAHNIPTSNTMNHLLLKMDLWPVEKILSSLHQKGRRSLVLCTKNTKALPKHSCLPMIVSSCLVSARPLGSLAIWNMHEI